MSKSVSNLHSISIRRSSPSIFIDGLTNTLVTLPLVGEETTVSIFMAPKMTSGSPCSTVSPTFTRTSKTSPGIGAPTEPRTPFVAYREVRKDWSEALTQRNLSYVTRQSYILIMAELSRCPDWTSHVLPRDFFLTFCECSFDRFRSVCRKHITTAITWKNPADNQGSTRIVIFQNIRFYEFWRLLIERSQQYFITEYVTDKKIEWLTSFFTTWSGFQ